MDKSGSALRCLVRRGRGRPKKAKGPAQHKKTAEELDAEMEDYFVGSENAPSGAAATNGAPAAAGDETMAEISVSRASYSCFGCLLDANYVNSNSSIPDNYATFSQVSSFQSITAVYFNLRPWDFN